MASRGHGARVVTPPYAPKDALQETFNYGLTTGIFGALFAGIQNTMSRKNYGFNGFFTKFGGTTATFGGFKLGIWVVVWI